MSTGLTRNCRAFWWDARGIAGMEFAVMALALGVALLNALDVGYYVYRRMQVEMAAQVGAQAAWKICSNQMTMLPATQNCAGLNAAITTAIQSTSLGTAVKLALGYPVEGYYCVNTSSNVLVSVGSLNNKPTSCTGIDSSGAAPGDYLEVQVSYTYVPLFKGIATVISAMNIKSITKTSWIRLG